MEGLVINTLKDIAPPAGLNRQFELTDQARCPVNLRHHRQRLKRQVRMIELAMPHANSCRDCKHLIARADAGGRPTYPQTDLTVLFPPKRIDHNINAPVFPTTISGFVIGNRLGLSKADR